MCNNQSIECFHLQVYPNASERPTTTDVRERDRATALLFPATDLEREQIEDLKQGQPGKPRRTNQ